MFRVPRYGPMAFHDLHGGPASICVADCTWRARFARPFVSRSHVMQVFLANFARTPRWGFTRSVHFIWSSAGRTWKALLLATGVLVLFTWALGTSARRCSKLAQITTGADNTCRSGITAKFATQTFVGAIFGSTVLTCYAILTVFTQSITKSSCSTSLTFGTAFVCLFANTARHACRGTFDF